MIYFLKLVKAMESFQALALWLSFRGQRGEMFSLVEEGLEVTLCDKRGQPKAAPRQRSTNR